MRNESAHSERTMCRFLGLSHALYVEPLRTFTISAYYKPKLEYDNRDIRDTGQNIFWAFVPFAQERKSAFLRETIICNS